MALPLFAVLVLLAKDIILTLLGPAWLPAVPVLQALAVAQGIFTTGFALEPVLSLAGAVRFCRG
ncbi:hypothetical protein [Gemmobacter sp. 24YEA27]|uniref:hypothetical protein n=1 Tax=Gemmobacter sp. 24YEA27 TaxID=3040672 RepID=UPI0024B3738F|nr:hypothetical protein [Gemmobacter sp. 24YEA27]